jgi:hypothetical protein
MGNDKNMPLTGSNPVAPTISISLTGHPRMTLKRKIGLAAVACFSVKIPYDLGKSQESKPWKNCSH